MKMHSTMLVVKNMDKAIEFYEKVLGLHIIQDFGVNKVLSGGIALQTEESWKKFIGKSNLFYGGNRMEVYFEEDDLISLLRRLKI